MSWLSFTVPKPDYLPGPPEAAASQATQELVLNQTFPLALNLTIGLMGLVAFAGILIAAISMLTAYGNEDRVTRAKTNLQYSLLGFAVIILAYAIVSIVVSVALPDQSWVPHAYALDTNALLPSENFLVSQHDDRVSLPSGDFLTQVIPAIVANVFFFIGFLTFIALLYGGALLVIGRGNEDYINKAKNIIIYSMMGLAFAVLGYALIYGIATVDLTQNPETTADDLNVDSFPNAPN